MSETIRRRRPLTARDAEFATGMSVRAAEEYRQHLAAFDDDERKDGRLQSVECRTCFYLRARMCGQGFTNYVCGLCATEKSHHNTCTPRVCRECATEHSLCRQCGGDLEMRQRRRNWPSPVDGVTS